MEIEGGVSLPLSVIISGSVDGVPDEGQLVQTVETVTDVTVGIPVRILFEPAVHLSQELVGRVSNDSTHGLGNLVGEPIAQRIE